jgi:hypothetical protein
MGEGGLHMMKAWVVIAIGLAISIFACLMFYMLERMIKK